MLLCKRFPTPLWRNFHFKYIRSQTAMFSIFLALAVFWPFSGRFLAVFRKRPENKIKYPTCIESKGHSEYIICTAKCFVGCVFQRYY